MSKNGNVIRLGTCVTCPSANLTGGPAKTERPYCPLQIPLPFLHPRPQTCGRSYTVGTYNGGRGILELALIDEKKFLTALFIKFDHKR